MGITISAPTRESSRPCDKQDCYLQKIIEVKVHEVRNAPKTFHPAPAEDPTLHQTKEAKRADLPEIRLKNKSLFRGSPSAEE